MATSAIRNAFPFGWGSAWIARITHFFPYPSYDATPSLCSCSPQWSQRSLPYTAINKIQFSKHKSPRSLHLCTRYVASLYFSFSAWSELSADIVIFHLSSVSLSNIQTWAFHQLSAGQTAALLFDQKRSEHAKTPRPSVSLQYPAITAIQWSKSQMLYISADIPRTIAVPISILFPNMNRVAITLNMSARVTMILSFWNIHGQISWVRLDDKVVWTLIDKLGRSDKVWLSN